MIKLLVLEKFNKIWGDLEKSYEEMKDSLNVNNRNDFLRALCFDSNGDSIIPSIKIALSNEMSKYNDDNKTMHSLLVEILDSVYFLFNSGELNLDEHKIENLNVIIISAVREKTNALLENKITPEEFVRTFLVKEDKVFMSSAEMFMKFGEVDSFCKLYRNSVVKVHLEESILNEFICLNDKTTDFLERTIKETGDLNKPFIGRVCLALQSIELNLEEIGSYVLCGRNNLQDGKIFGRNVKSTKDSDVVTYRDITIRLV